MTSNQALVRDNSTLANFKQWAQAISNFFTTTGWVQASDTGQVNWSTIASVPTSGNYVYEVWKPGDGLTAFYLKIEYGTNSSSGPGLRLTLSTATNGAGTQSGFITTSVLCPRASHGISNGSSSVQYQCYLSGDSGRICIMMWRDDPGNGQTCFVIQRSINSSGMNTGNYVTIAGATYSNGAGSAFQQSLVFGAGVANGVPQNNGNGRLLVISNQAVTTDDFAGSTPMSPIFPSVGYFDNPMDALALGRAGDFTEDTTYAVGAANAPYGVSHSYICGKMAAFSFGLASGNTALLMRYD